MTYAMKPVLMGGAMGLAMPWMMHMGGGEAGILFVVAHVAVVLMLASLALFFPSVRRRLRGVLYHLFHMPVMMVGLALGWAATCAFCLWIGGVHWT